MSMAQMEIQKNVQEHICRLYVWTWTVNYEQFGPITGVGEVRVTRGVCGWSLTGWPQQFWMFWWFESSLTSKGNKLDETNSDIDLFLWWRPCSLLWLVTAFQYVVVFDLHLSLICMSLIPFYSFFMCSSDTTASNQCQREEWISCSQYGLIYC